MAVENKRVFCKDCIYSTSDYFDAKCKCEKLYDYNPVRGPVDSECCINNKNFDCKYYTTREMLNDKKGALSLSE